jgi:hypothetical protein
LHLGTTQFLNWVNCKDPAKPVSVVYDSENMGGNVERVLGHIAWLEEVQKPDSAATVSNERQ